MRMRTQKTQEVRSVRSQTQAIIAYLPLGNGALRQTQRRRCLVRQLVQRKRSWKKIPEPYIVVGVAFFGFGVDTWLHREEARQWKPHL